LKEFKFSSGILGKIATARKFAIILLASGLKLK
jgi:hypothetical protein